MSDVVLDVGIWRPYVETPVYQTLISRSVTGKEQRRLMHTLPIRRFQVNFGIRSRTEMTTIKDFYEARYGEYDTFYFPNNNDRISDEVIGSKDDTDTHTCANLPMGNQIVSGDQGVLVEDVDYTLVKMTGVITFIGDGWTTLVVSYDPCVQVRFAGEVRFEEFSHNLFRIEAELIEVL